MATYRNKSIVKPFKFSAVKNILLENQVNNNIDNKTAKKNQQSDALEKIFKKLEFDYDFNKKFGKEKDKIDIKYQEYGNAHKIYQILQSDNISYQFKSLRNVSLIQKGRIERSQSQSIFNTNPQEQTKIQTKPQSRKKIQQKKSIVEIVEKVRLSSSLSKNNIKSVPPLALSQKFRKNIYLIKKKLQAMKLTLNQIFQHNLLTKNPKPYQFGKEIFRAIKQNDQAKLWRQIILNRYSIFSIDLTGKTPLIWASIRGHHKILLTLLEKGAEVNREDEFGHSAIHYSIKYGHPECTKLLTLYLCNIKQPDFYLSKDSSNVKVRNIVNLWKGLSQIMSKLTMEKRIDFLNEQYKYHYHDWE